MVIKILKLVTYIVNVFHDLLGAVLSAFGFSGDKEQHFLVVGSIGIVLFFGIHFVVKRLAKWRLEAVSFLITGFLLLAMTFGIEIIQLMTGSGNVESRDIMAGLWGFLVFFCIYLVIRYVYRKITRPKDQ
jgi:hypothetical protein